MNGNQKIVLGIAAAALAIVFLFPPFDQNSLAFKVPTFAGFYLFSSPPQYGVVNTSLLLLETFVVLINAGIGWLLLQDRPAAAPPAKRRGSYQNAALIFAGLNLVLILLFPPFESVFALTNAALPSFEGFYFVFGQRPNHTIVTTLLYIEVIFVLVNGALAWLIFSKRRAPELTPEEAHALAAALTRRKS